MSYRPMVQVIGEPGKWHGNALRFATKQEAEDNARDLMSRWMLVTDTSAEISDDPVNYRWVDGRLKALETETL